MQRNYWNNKRTTKRRRVVLDTQVATSCAVSNKPQTIYSKYRANKADIQPVYRYF